MPPATLPGGTLLLCSSPIIAISFRRCCLCVSVSLVHACCCNLARLQAAAADGGDSGGPAPAGATQGSNAGTWAFRRLQFPCVWPAGVECHCASSALQGLESSPKLTRRSTGANACSDSRELSNSTASCVTARVGTREEWRPWPAREHWPGFRRGRFRLQQISVIWRTSSRHGLRHQQRIGGPLGVGKHR